MGLNYIVRGEFDVIVSEKRKKRPHGVPPNWCPFCPGNEHLAPPAVYEVRDAEGWKIRVIPNKYPALSPESEEAYGYHEVVIEHPDHGRTFWLHTIPHIALIIDTWGRREKALYQDDRIQYVAIFKNWGARAGASVPHGHSQILALPFVPPRVKQKLSGVSPSPLIVYEGEHWIVDVPKTPRYAYEVHVHAKDDVYHVYDLNHDQKHELAFILRTLIERVTRIIDAYNFFVFTSPREGRIPVHVEIYPRKNIHAGFELGTCAFIVPVAPETALAYYREAFG